MALDLRAGDVYGHSQRVGRYSVELARHLGYDRPALKRLEHAALVHDIGKMRIPDSILLKPAQLTPDENAVMRTHVTIGYELVRAQPRLAPYAELVFTHHERFDGQGYPRGLAGGAVPLDARIFAVADTLDAMTSERPYRKALGWDVAHAEIVRHSGSQFDPKVVRAFCEIPAVTWIRIGTTQPVLTFTERQ
jgi:putative nucleotidyltransferase with HDIG domain